MITPLQPPDSLHLQAAQGWLELGDHIAANEELDNITAALRVHPDVLELRWRIYAAANKWEAALDIASAIIQIDPDNPAGWEDRSYALDELGRLVEARDNLFRVVDRFPKNAIMRYNLATYECKVGRLAQAKAWLEKSFLIGDSRVLKLMALDDPDLEPLRSHIRDL